jgi:hypothetical protein
MRGVMSWKKMEVEDEGGRRWKKNGQRCTYSLPLRYI